MRLLIHAGIKIKPYKQKGPESFDVFFDLRLDKRLSKNREAGDLRRHHAHYDVIVMETARYSDLGVSGTCVISHVSLVKTQLIVT